VFANERKNAMQINGIPGGTMADGILTKADIVGMVAGHGRA